MPAKGYWIAQVDVHDPEAYKAYQAAVRDCLPKFQGRFIVRGGTAERMEGKGRSRTVVIEFPDYATALACYRSAEYAKAKALRQSIAEADLVVIEGYEGG